MSATTRLQRARLRCAGMRECDLPPPAEIARARRWLARARVMALRLSDAPALARAANAEAGRWQFRPDALVAAVVLDGWPDGHGDPATKMLVSHYRRRWGIQTHPDARS